MHMVQPSEYGAPTLQTTDGIVMPIAKRNAKNHKRLPLIVINVLLNIILRFCRYDTIRYDSVYLTCSKKLTGSQLSPPHGVKMLDAHAPIFSLSNLINAGWLVKKCVNIYIHPLIAGTNRKAYLLHASFALKDSHCQ